MKLVASILLALAAATAFWQVPVRRYRANLDRRQIDLLVSRAEASASEAERRALALRAIELTHAPLETNPVDYKTLILKGVAEAAAGRDEAALATWRHSLTINERPETYAYLGVLQMERGEVDAAMTNLMRAAEFNVVMARLVAPSTQKLIYDELKKQKRLPQPKEQTDR